MLLARKGGRGRRIRQTDRSIAITRFAGERAEREDRASVKSRLGVRVGRGTGGRDGNGEEGALSSHRVAARGARAFHPGGCGGKMEGRKGARD